MRRSASEKLELIRIVESSDLSVRATLVRLGGASATITCQLTANCGEGVSSPLNRLASPALSRSLPGAQETQTAYLGL